MGESRRAGARASRSNTGSGRPGSATTTRGRRSSPATPSTERTAVVTARRAARLRRNETKVPMVGATKAASVRTGAQAGGAALLVALIASFVSLDAVQALALTGFLTWLFATAQNALENYGVIPAV